MDKILLISTILKYFITELDLIRASIKRVMGRLSYCYKTDTEQLKACEVDLTSPTNNNKEYMKSKLILALLAAFVSNVAFSAEYMMCFNTTPKFAKIKQVPLKCEVDEQRISTAKLDELSAQGWKVDHMTVVPETGGTFYTTYLLLTK